MVPRFFSFVGFSNGGNDSSTTVRPSPVRGKPGGGVGPPQVQVLYGEGIHLAFSGDGPMRSVTSKGSLRLGDWEIDKIVWSIHDGEIELRWKEFEFGIRDQ